MAFWSSTYQPEERTRLAPGNYRLELVEVSTGVSQAGNNMLILTVRPNGESIKIKHYIVEGEYFNRNLTEFKDSFEIAYEDDNILTWPGAIGAGKLYEDKEGYLKVRYFITGERQDNLPPWQGPMPQRASIMDPVYLEPADDEELPF